MKKYEISYTSDVWETVIIEASSKEEAEKLFNQGEHYEQGHDPEERGKENLKIDSVEEVDPDTERPIKKEVKWLSGTNTVLGDASRLIPDPMVCDV